MENAEQLIAQLQKLVAVYGLKVLGQLGIQTTSFIAMLGAAGLAIALALQGSLTNFAAGFRLIMVRPFKISDFIEDAAIAGCECPGRVCRTR